MWEIITGLAGAVAQGYGPEHGQCLPDGLQRAESRGDVDHSGFLEGHLRDVAGLGCCSKLRQELLVKRGKKQKKKKIFVLSGKSCVHVELVHRPGSGDVLCLTAV